MSVMDVPHLLVSVRNPHEAASAIAGGADVIDVKEPAHGAMGMASRPVIEAVIDRVGGNRPVSAALGELHEGRGEAPISDRLRYVKLGLAHAPRDWQRPLADHCAMHAPERFVAVAYGDHHRVAAPPVGDVLEWAIAHGAAGVLIDTAVKDGRGLLEWCDSAALAGWIELAHRHRLLMALAGSLDAAAMCRAASLRPDVIAVRGAACIDGDRGGAVDAGRVAHLKSLLQARTWASAPRAPRRAG